MTYAASDLADPAHSKSSPSLAARRAILAACFKHVPFDGWTHAVLKKAAVEAGYPKGAEGLYFPDGPLEVIGFWSQECDRAAVNALAERDLSSLKIRERVTEGVWARLNAVGPHETAAKRALSRMLVPDALGQGPTQLWASADLIWRAIGDTSTDMNYYSKRTLLSAVIGSSVLSWLGDDSADKSVAREFLEARIANVMQFEKVKWDVKKRTQNWPDPAEILGRLRYGSRPGRRRRRS